MKDRAKKVLFLDRAGREGSQTRGVLRADKISPVAGARSEKETKIPLLLLAETGPGLGIQLRELSMAGRPRI